MMLGAGSIAAPSLSGAAALLPVRRSWLLGVVSALLLCAAVVALGFAAAAGRAASDLAGQVAETATLSIIAEEAEVEAQARAALEILRDAPGVLEVRVMEPGEQRALLAPWLGTGIAVDGVALPLMMEVETDRTVLDVPSLVMRLAADAPGAVFEDHSAWRLPIIAAAERQERLANLAAILAVLGLVGAAALYARAAIAASAQVIETLTLLGMPEGTIAGTIARRTGEAVLLGGLAGTLGGVLAVGGLAVAAETGFAVGFSGWRWLLPPLALALATVAAAAAGSVAARRLLRAWP